MPLSPGARLGAYEIVSLLGAGAMGEVYRARDTRLGREVALKILPAEFAGSPDRRRRFEQEARAAGALNHPNIVAVYDTGEQDGVSYIVSELVEGEPLRDLMRRGPMPVRKTLDIAAQVADGLSCAHGAGIVHRDLKPENIMLARDGRPKILDFGLARYQPPPSSEGTLTVTQPGMVMGTVGYMSPEQVTGAPADARSDIFSLGIILAEMLAGTLPFARPTTVETMSAILRDDPAELPADVPPALRQIVLHCLEKEPSRRFQSAQDLAFNLRGLSVAGGSIIAPAPQLVAPPPRRRALLPILTTVLAVAVAACVALLLLRPSGTNLAAYRFTPLATDAGPQNSPVWSPDGRSVAYIKPNTGAPDSLMIRSLDSQVPAAVAKADARSLFWAADSARLYYLTDAGVWAVSRAGGEPQRVLKGDFGSATLSPDGKTLAVWLIDDRSGKETNKIQISSPPGNALRAYEPVLFRSDGSFLPVYLHFAPDGNRILVSMTHGTGPEVWLLPFPDGPAAHGKPRRLFASAVGGGGPPSFSWMPDGRRVVMAFAPAARQESQLWIGDTESGRLDCLTADEIRKTSPTVAPDGKRIAYASESVDFDLVELPLSGEPPRPLLATSRSETFPAWSPAGSQFAYVTNRSGQDEIWLKSAREDWMRPLVTQRDFPDDETLGLMTLAFSPDGTRLAYARQSVRNLAAIWISPAAGGAPVRLTSTDDYEVGPSWSPDGNWIAYFSTKTGLTKAHVGSSDPPVGIADRGCENPPQWSPDGQWIACATGDGVLLMSPEGKNTRTLGKRRAYAAWSRDGKTLYTLGREAGKWSLDSIDVKSGTEKSIFEFAKEVAFESPSNPSFPLSVSPDGKSLATSVLNYRSDIWMLEGFR